VRIISSKKNLATDYTDGHRIKVIVVLKIRQRILNWFIKETFREKLTEKAECN